MFKGLLIFIFEKLQGGLLNGWVSLGNDELNEVIIMNPESGEIVSIFVPFITSALEYPPLSHS